MDRMIAVGGLAMAPLLVGCTMCPGGIVVSPNSVDTYQADSSSCTSGEQTTRKMASAQGASQATVSSEGMNAYLTCMRQKGYLGVDETTLLAPPKR